MVSVVTPAYNERDNLEALYERLHAALDGLPLDWEWVAVDDHSADGTFEELDRLAHQTGRVRGVRLARNSGSHLAIACGLEKARGDCAVVMAADLQDPPEAIPQLLEKWRQGAQIVWGVRSGREGESWQTVAGSRLYYLIMRHAVGIRELPAAGADFVLIDRRVIRAINDFEEDNASILATLAWIGFRQDRVVYQKEARHSGESGWTLRRKLKLVVDSITSFSYGPIRWMSYVGFVVALLGFAYAALVIRNGLTGSPVEGWASLMVVVLVLCGIQMIMMGVLGEYLWRALHEARRRPRYLIEDETGE